jgi:hypothetical protein
LLYHFDLKKLAKIIPAFCAAGLVLVCVSCVSCLSPRTPEADVEAAVPYNPPQDSGDSPLSFARLPPEIRIYLGDLEIAFKNHDLAFLESQGETHYAQDLFSKYNREQYLAMLYRAGPYAHDSTWEIPPYKLDVKNIRRVKWTEFAEKGPVLEVDGVFLLAAQENGDTEIPCRLMLLWRLKEPKIIGTYP